MKKITPEFHRPIEVARIPPGGSAESIETVAAEREALAKRFDVLAIPSLSATLQVEQWRRNGVKVTGSLLAEVEQTCIVTLDNFVATVREPVERIYLPSTVSTGDESDDEADEIVDGVIDLGELVAETLALAIDPYPRKPGAEFDHKLSTETPDQTSPFAALGTAKSARP